MNAEAPLLDATGYLVIAGYALALAAVGIAGWRSRKDESLGDFYLGGRSLGPLVLFLTLYATQYSGLTLVGFAGRAYRNGFSFLVAVSFGCAVIGGYVMVAPRLNRLSSARRYITPGDYLEERYRSRPLTFAGTAIFIFALAAYILSNLKAIGHVVERSTGGEVSFAQGILALSLLMVAYETLGGLRAVAWSDVLQGVILMIGCVVIFFAVGDRFGSLEENVAQLLSHSPHKAATPSLSGKLSFLSTLVLVCFGVSIYPHAIQRIYAARDDKTLRTSLQLMLLMPFVTTLLMILIGIIGAAQLPGLDRDQSEQIVLRMLSLLAAEDPGMRMLILLLLTAVLAAIMSTVDSALLSISSLVTRDLYAHLRPSTREARLTAIGKAFSWALMALLSWLAMELPQTLWRLTEIKLEVLCQMAPAFVLGLHAPRVCARGIGTGLGIGLAVTAGLLLTDARPLGVHAGVWGLLANFAVAAAASRDKPFRPSAERAHRAGQASTASGAGVTRGAR